MRYIFGEIMYGGHITDFWDRRTNNTYLSVLLNPSILRGGDLVPCSESFGQFLHAEEGESPPALFPSPNPTGTSKDAYSALVEDSLPVETPILFGMHPNAEIGYLTSTAKELLEALLTLEGGAKEEVVDKESGAPGRFLGWVGWVRIAILGPRQQLVFMFLPPCSFKGLLEMLQNTVCSLC